MKPPLHHMIVVARHATSLLSAMAALVLTAPFAHASLSPARTAAHAAAVNLAPTDFSGTWTTNFGDVAIKQTGMMASGEYTSGRAKATITGKVEGRRFTFTYTEPGAAGEGWFEMDAGGEAFAGLWKQSGKEGWGEWSGRRAGAHASFAGLWRTSFGPMRITDAAAGGGACSGIYLYSGLTCTITGAAKDGTLTFTYEQPDGERGEGAFALDGPQAFKGTWKSAGGAEGEWTGTRTPARPGVTNLVVLEAHWERSLGDRTYSFGEMLRTFFQRVPGVAFHHRFVHDEADVRRFAAESAFLAEPVVLYFSSHGTDKGLSMGGRTVPPEVIASAIKGASNIRLLHFGACEVMAGDAPDRIAAATGGAFPISGYANTADWGGSAVVDLTYLSLVLEHGLASPAAIDEVRRSISFASTGGQRRTIAPSALTIFVPGQGKK